MVNLIKGNAPNNVKADIIKLLTFFQEGYTKRDITAIDLFMDNLFDKEEDVIIFGTSDEELFLNYDEAKELIESDWKWWGDVKINIDDTIISSSGEVSWFSTTGTVKYKYDNSEDTYSRWLNQVIVENYFAEGKTFNQDNAKYDFLQINWLLNHKLHDWGNKPEREYLSPIRLTGVVNKINGRWIIKQMQFSLPQPYYPDMRIGNKEMERERFEKVKERLGAFKPKRIADNQQEIRNLLNKFEKDYLGSHLDNIDFINKYIDNSDDTNIIGTDSTWAIGRDAIENLLLEQQRSWDAISIDIDEAIICEENNVAWLTTTGIITKNSKEEEVLKNQYDNIKEIIKKDITPKEKLFEIRKNISLTLKEIEKGDEYLWPFHFEAVLIKNNGTWKFNYLQFSFPFYFILEGLRDDILI